MIQLDLLSDLSSRVNYNLSDFPVLAYIGEMKQFLKNIVPCHWHPDLEFHLILEGEMDYLINGRKVSVSKDQGIFINSRQLHTHSCDPQSNCFYLVLNINPYAFGENLRSMKRYADEKFDNSCEDFIVLTGRETWHSELFRTLRQIHEEMQRPDFDLFFVLSLSAAACSGIREQIKARVPGQGDVDHWMTIWKMTGFIHKNYGNKLSLDDIAASGSVCRSRCCELFNEFVSQSPGAYLIDYRIQKSREMLRGTSGSIVEIALSCGFQSASYFSCVFRKETGLTPREYRREL